jgi:hypothetical protein
MGVEQRQLRNRLRARGRALGDDRDIRSGVQQITRLVEAAAYEHWHRLLFTRFLAGNDLLFTDAENGNVAVTLEECEELAPELGAKDGFELACRFSSETLPGVFRRDDPVLEISLAANHTIALRKLVESLPDEVFRAQDALGWTYQFWQTRRKKEVNESGTKIGAAELSPVTQLFTEDYMVEFLLHNTLGAWWAGRCLEVSGSKFQVSRCPTEEDARRAASLPPRDGLPGIDWTYLRFVRSDGNASAPEGSQLETLNLKPETPAAWRPAAGTFDGWPTEAKGITFLDPCMGSGHFPVFALPILARLRMEEEGLGAAEAVAAVLRDNIHGLELDPRCCQIGAFNLALAAWKLGGYQALPPLQIACSGLAPQGKKEDWVALAGDNQNLQRGMERLYKLFEKAAVLGSLINPRLGGDDLFEAEFQELQPLLEKALAGETRDDTAHEMAVTARGLAKAAEMLAGQFTLVATNVPYIGQKKQHEILKDFCESTYSEAKADLATCFLERCLDSCAAGGSVALVTPHNWLFLGAYTAMRKKLLSDVSWDVVARLGARAFETIGGEVVNVALVGLSQRKPSIGVTFAAVDVADERDPSSKGAGLLGQSILKATQADQLRNPDFRISFGLQSKTPRLSAAAISMRGIVSGDGDRWFRQFWELPRMSSSWKPLQTTVRKTLSFGGRDQVIDWSATGDGMLRPGTENRAYGNLGIALGQVGDLPATFYTGELYDNNTGVLVPLVKASLPALWAFCSSEYFTIEVRRIDQALKVTNATFLKIPFDLAHWQKVAAEKYPHGLPKPFSSDPTQWLFIGHPAGADQPLHVAVARLVGYQWPRQTGSSFPDCPALEPDGLESFADNDGVVCLSAIHREATAASRLRKLLAAALGSYDERALIKESGSTKTTLEDWLRDDFFKQHVALFHNRPFVWHVWDGLSDGFHVLVNYHRLDHATLNTLTYTYLGDWIREQKAAAAQDVPGAAERLKSAQALQGRLAAILEGEAPLDLFVRWKPLAKQAIGWHPDLNDGVRLNIRPFLLAGDVGLKGAGLFRTKPGIVIDPAKADRGTEPLRDKDEYPWFWCKDPPGTDPVPFPVPDPIPGKNYPGRRWNGVHLTLAKKREAQP